MDDLTYRVFGLRGTAPASLDAENRSVEIVLATEAPTEVFDFERYEIVREVLLASGAQFPKSRQVPLLDSHQRFDTASVIGSIRELKSEADTVTGRAMFSGVANVEDTWAKVREGHLTDFSAGYKPIDSQWVPEGESYDYRGKTYAGPVRVTKKWVLKEGSIVPIGADEFAKARAATHTKDAATINNHAAKKGDKSIMDKTEAEQIRVEERERVSEITAMCRRFAVDDLAENLINKGVSVDAARAAVLDRIEARGSGTDDFAYRMPYDGHPATITADAVEKRSEATIDGLVLRAGVPLEKPAAGADEYRQVSLVDIARECLMAAGVNVRGMGKDAIIRQGLQQRAAATGNFPYILANTANKTLRESYQLAPSTYQLWTRDSMAQDFKEMSRNALSEAPALSEVPEHGEYLYGKFAESKEVYQIAKYGKLFAITREALVNDDLSAFTRVPQAFAASAKRGVNEAAYACLIANANMADGNALFSAAHGNFVGSGSGAAPDETTLTAGRLAMRTQTGLNSALLNVAPEFLIVPAALETTADKLLNSLGDLADDKSSAVRNPFYKKLTPVVEAYLDATSAVGWYLAANPQMIDTVEVAFLGGNKEPYLETREGWSVDGTEYKIRFEYGVKAIDWRGLYFNYGS